MNWYRFDPERRRLTLTIHVQPNARRTEPAGRHGDALKIRIAAPAVDNQANAELIDFLHQWFKLPKISIAIKHGARGRRKVVEIDSPGADVQASLESMMR